jgi:Holliday junction resolvase RusA-like endonuclease
VIRFFVAGIPKSMKVSGVARFQRAGKVHMVPKRSNSEWATLVGQIGRQHAPPVPLDGAIVFTALFFMPRPKSAPKRVTYPLTKPDIDNLCHKLTDQWNGVFYRDDAQIVRMNVGKTFATDGRAGVEITVREVTPLDVVDAPLVK